MPRDKTRHDETLLVALAAGASSAEAARRVGVSPRTAQRRLADPAFLARVQSARKQAVQAAADAVARELAARVAAALTPLVEGFIVAGRFAAVVADGGPAVHAARQVAAGIHTEEGEPQ